MTSSRTRMRRASKRCRACPTPLLRHRRQGTSLRTAGPLPGKGRFCRKQQRMVEPVADSLDPSPGRDITIWPLLQPSSPTSVLPFLTSTSRCRTSTVSPNFPSSCPYSSIPITQQEAAVSNPELQI